MNDLKFAFRRLLKNPGFTIVAVLTLALGIGANTAIFGLINELLLRPRPLKEPDKLLGIVLTDPTGDFASQSTPHPIFQDYREMAREVFAELAAYAPAFAPVEVRGETRFTIVQLASANFFSTLGVPPAIGRFFTEAEDRPSHQGAVTVLSHGCWQGWFNGDPEVVGKTITFRPPYAEPFVCTIIGVAPRGIRGLEPANQPAPQFWLPAVMEKHLKDFTQVSFRMIGRLAPGLSHRAAEAALDVTAASIAAKHGGRPIPGYENEGIFRSDLRTDLRPAALGIWGAFRPHGPLHKARLLAFGVAGLVLLIACANIANLTLVRAERHRRETAIRLSLGAGQSRILRTALTESVLVSALGGIAGLALAQAANRALMALKPSGVELLVETRVDWRVAGFCVAVALISGLLVGLLPAWRGSRQDPNLALKGPPGGGQTGGWLLRHGFAAAQVAMSLVLLISAGLCLRSLGSLLTANPGLDVEHLIVAPVRFQSVPETSAPAHYQDLVDGLTGLPGIESVSWTRVLPLLPGGGGISRPVDRIEGYEPRTDETLNVAFTDVAPDYFRTMGMAIAVPPDRPLSGAGSRAWVNEAFVRRYWPGGNPIGRQVSSWVVEGVVKDAPIKNLWDPPAPYLYHETAEPDARSGILLLRTKAEPSAVLNQVRSALLAADPELDLSRLMPLRQGLDQTLRPQRFMVVLLGAFAGCAVLLAVIGIYGVISYLVTQHTREIGIRMALGAQRGTIAGWVLRRGAHLTLAGVGLGLFGSWATTRLLASFLFGVTPTDPLTFAVLPAILGGAAMLACWLPARRAAKVDPMEALRNE